MTYKFRRWEVAIKDVLSQCSRSIEEVRSRYWEFQLSDDPAFPIIARMADNWVRFEALLGNGPSASGSDWELLGEQGNGLGRLWQLLQFNTEIPGGGKFVVGYHAPLVRLCAEIPLVEGIELTQRVRAACEGFITAWTKVHGCFEPAQRKVRPDSSGSEIDLAHVCRETGWPFVERSGGGLVFDLETPDGFYQASIEERRGQFRVEVEITVCESTPDPCRQALALLLLATSGIVCMVRAAAKETDSRSETIGFEVVFDHFPCAAELNQALGALSTACRISGREAVLLQQDEKVARAYLNLWWTERNAKREMVRMVDGNKITKAQHRAEKGEELCI